MNDLNEEILKEIKLTNRLLSYLLIKDKTSQTEKILMLDSFGFTAKNIAEFLDTKINNVTGILSRARKVKNKKLNKGDSK